MTGKIAALGRMPLRFDEREFSAFLQGLRNWDISEHLLDISTAAWSDLARIRANRSWWNE
jgi:hypothetical protein